jgi:hypothetical protein
LLIHNHLRLRPSLGPHARSLCSYLLIENLGQIGRRPAANFLRMMCLVGLYSKVAARRCVVPSRHGACAYRLRGDGAVFGDLEMLAGASRRVRDRAMPS